jgi:hypothetical protein
MCAFLRPRFLILTLLLISGPGWLLASVWWNESAPGVSTADWLPTDVPCEPVQFENTPGATGLELVVDLPVGPDSQVCLLATALDGMSGTVTTVASIEEISADRRSFRPAPLITTQSVSAELIPEVVSKPSFRQSEATAIQPFETSSAAAKLPVTSREFWIHVTAQPLEDRRGYQKVVAKLVCRNASVQVYVDQHAAGGAELMSQANRIAEVLDREVVPAVQKFIGPVFDRSRDDRLTVLMTPWLGRLQGGATQVSGFVRGTDFQSGLEPPFSNRAAVLYLNTQLPQDRGLKTLLLHEVAHAAIFSDAQGKSPCSAVAIEDWINEGVAHLAERRLGGDWSNVDYRIARFYQSPESAPLVVSDYFRSSRWRDHGCRGACCLFFDRFGRNSTRALPLLRNLSQRHQSLLKQAEFERNIRDWTIALAQTSWSMDAPRKRGRFLNSGPRFQIWNVTETSELKIKAAATATHFIELRSPRPGWFRLRIPRGGLNASWQVTVLKRPTALSGISATAAWTMGDTAGAQQGIGGSSEPSERRLVVTLSEKLPAGWTWSAVACEAIEGGDRPPQNWILDSEQQNSEAAIREPQWVQPGLELILPVSFEASQLARILKVRLQGPDGRISWIWTNVPKSNSDATPLRLTSRKELSTR